MVSRWPERRGELSTGTDHEGPSQTTLKQLDFILKAALKGLSREQAWF